MAARKRSRDYSERMSLERMFEDLEGRLAHLEAQQMRATAEDLARGERAQVPLVDRLRGAMGARLVVHGEPGVVVDGRLADVGDGWIGLVENATAARNLVPLGAITLIEGLAARVRPEVPAPLGRQNLRQVLRDISRDRSVVRVATRAAVITGRIAGVGGDAIDLSRSPTGERGATGRSAAIADVTVPLGAILLVTVSV